MLLINTKIKLISFNGTLEAPKDCEPKENYWSLIGEIGIIKALKNDRNRFLVQIRNSLWILEKDLKVIE